MGVCRIGSKKRLIRHLLLELTSYPLCITFYLRCNKTDDPVKHGYSYACSVLLVR